VHNAAIPADVVEHLRRIALGLPEVTEQELSAGYRWRIRTRTFVSVHNFSDKSGEALVLVFRSEPPELAALHNSGHPFFRPGWGRDGVGMIIDDDTDWAEVAELVADSYCILAPKKLAALVQT
jgi:hypothetical protein